MSAKIPDVLVVDSSPAFTSTAFQGGVFTSVCQKVCLRGAQAKIKRITFCVIGQMRLRKIVSGSRMHPTGKHSNWTAGRMIQWELLNEKLAFVPLDFRYDIQTYREQACEIVCIDDEGRVCHG